MALNFDQVYWRVVARVSGQAGALISDVRTFTVSSESDTLVNSLGMTFKCWDVFNLQLIETLVDHRRF
ncbi:hypothetical protein [Desulfobacter sp.]|uniref:hypothetical protein n=1 Tax=Desulfobacter sp. TaxID=2294 RepID=UPI00257B744E|nr:hypothetical protein [Desulfobacter sp.]